MSDLAKRAAEEIDRKAYGGSFSTQIGNQTVIDSTEIIQSAIDEAMKKYADEVKDNQAEADFIRGRSWEKLKATNTELQAKNAEMREFIDDLQGMLDPHVPINESLDASVLRQKLLDEVDAFLVKHTSGKALRGTKDGGNESNSEDTEGIA